MEFGWASHRIESKLDAAAHILEVEADAEFIHLPNLIIFCQCFGDPETKTFEAHFLRCSGRLVLGNLHKVHQIYRRVVHEMSSIGQQKSSCRYQRVNQSAAFWLSAIYPLPFGSSPLVMFIAGFRALLGVLQLTVVTKSTLHVSVCESVPRLFLSFATM